VRDDRLLIEDIRDAIEVVLRYTPGQRSDFDSNPPVQSHIIRHIQIIGEAAWRVSPAVKAANPQVPWKAIAAMRHVLVHDYFRVDWNQVWNVATTHVPLLQPQIAAILSTLPPSP